MGILLPPPAAPHNATVRNTAVLSADYSSGNRTAAESVVAGTPEAAFFSKYLISDPVIEVEDLPAAWRVHWVNYNNYSLGQGRFVDVFPYNGDGRGTDFNGTATLTQIARVGSATQAGTVIELTSDAPGTVGASPAASTAWHVVDPADPGSWEAAVGGTPTAIRITVPNIEASTQGYGAVDLHFEVDGQRKDDIYHNDASATVYNTVQDATVNLGTRSGDPVRVIASSIAGVAWVDRDADGIRQPTEALLPNVTVHLYRDGDTSTPFRTATTDANGAYHFTQLHSSDYQVVFDVDELKAMGYRLTDQSVGSDTTVDSDADVDTGEVDQLTLPRETDVVNLDAGLIAIGLQAAISADASLTRSYDWSIAKAATNKDGLAVDPDTGAATVEYSVVTTEGAYADSNAQLSGEVTVTNPSEEKAYTFTATVAADGTGLTCTVTNGQDREIAPGAILTLPYSCAGSPGDDLDRTLTVTVAATDIDPATGQPVEPVQATADTEYQVNEVNRTVHVTDAATIGGTAQADREFGPYTWSAEGTEHTETYAVDVTVPAGECLAVDNTATIDETGQLASESLSACLPLDLTIEKNVVTSLQRSYGWSIDKRLANPGVQLDEHGEATLEYEVVVTEGAQDDASWTMSGEVTVSNPNRYKSVDATVTDVADIGGGVVCAFAGGDTVTLAAGETRTLSYSCSFTSEPAYSGVNTATVAWQSDVAGTNRALVEDRSAVATADILEDAWALTEFQKTVSVEDIAEIDGAAQAPRALGPYTWSAEGTEHVESYSVDIAVDAGTCLLIDNTATIVELGSSAATQHTLCREAPLSIADPAAASLVRTFDWSIAKQLVNREDIADDETPESVDAQYAVTVTEGGYTDSAHQLTGQVEITNPNDYRSYTVDVANTISIDGLECALANASNVVIPANGTVTLPYTCTGDPGEVLSGTHGVTVTGADIETLSHEEEVGYTITEVNRTVTVTDDRYAFDPAWQITWSEQGTEHLREYALRVETAVGACQTFENTATLAETGQSSTAGFRVCAPEGSVGGGFFERLVQTGGAVGPLPAIAALLLLAGLIVVLRRRSNGSEQRG
nr:SdrD B-like domain-containing protein [Leucobacter ruminantium]